MKKVIKIILGLSFVLASLILFTPAEAQSTNSTYKYDKNGWFQYDVDAIKLYWIEECTSESGGQCTESSGKFRFDMTLLLTLARDLF